MMQARSGTERHALLSLLSLLCAGVLSACASDPSAAPALAASAASLEAARSSGAPELAASELNEARSKLERARALAQAGRNKEAVRMAEQADVDAQLARARTGSERSRRAVDELEAGLRTLREELSRAGKDTPTSAPMQSVRPQP
jgi:chromosome segregation ATPase